MTLKVARLPLAEGVADKVLREMKISSLPIDPIAIAAIKDIKVQATSQKNKGFSGMLVQWDTDFGIMYGTHIDNAGFQRFSISHELGHYFIPGHIEQVLANGAHTSNAGFGSRDPYEQEADFFASALLMPTSLLKPMLNRHDDGLGLVKLIAGNCVTSLTASAVRYARISRSAVAVVISTAGVVDFCIFSDAMKDAKVRWLRPGLSVPSGTITAEIAASPDNVRSAREALGSADLMNWFDTPNSHVVSEEVIGLGAYGKVLTILYSSRISAETEGFEDEDDEDDLIDRWTPKFHR